jgi:outer membrane protein TolC
MRFLSFSRYLFLLSAALWAGLSAGCTPVDRWEIYDNSLNRDTYKDESPPTIVPVEFQTPTTEPPALPSSAEKPIELSVEQAVMLALRNNLDLEVQQLSPVIVGTFEQIERGTFDPEFFAEAEYFDESSNEISRSSGELFSVSANEAGGGVGLRQLLPSGTTIEAVVAQDRITSDRAPELQTARVGLSVTQSLLRGFGSAVNLASVRQAELDTLASIDELQGFTQALLADTEIAYWNYVLANEKIAIFEESLEVAKKQREEIEQRIEVGILPEIEVAAARSEEALRVQALINARSQLEDRRLRILRLISPGPYGHLDWAITTTSELRITPQPITSLSDRLQLAEQSRPDLNEARLRLQQNRLETIVTRNGVLPRLDLFISLGKTGFADTFPDSFRELNGNTYDLTAGVRLSQFIGNRAAQASNLAAFAAQQQAADAVANLRQLVHLDVRLAVNEVERTRQLIDASRATRIFQEQTVEAEKERFDVGASTTLQIAQAQRDLLLIQIAEVEAIVNYRIALVRLYLAEGSLLEYRGVQLAGSS